MALREVGALIGLAALGGTWAVAMGHRRVLRPERTAMLDARTQVQVRLDALRARIAILNRHDLPPLARRLVDHAVEDHVLIDAVLSRAASVDDVVELTPQIDDALVSIEQAASQIGVEMPANQPFAGLCSIDPAHGAADSTAAGSPCLTCALAIAAGNPPSPRRVTQAGRPVPFDGAE